MRELERLEYRPRVHAAGAARSRVESRRWTPAWRCSPRTTPSAPGRLPRWSRSAGTGRCGSPSTRTSRRAARRPTRAAASCRAATRTRYDLFVAMTAAAAATTRLRVGSGICLVIERDPIVTAKEVASIDHLSGGRVEFGVGAGWNREEMAQPRHRPEAPLQRHARARRGDEGDLDPGGGELPRRARRLRPHLVVAEAGPAPAPAGGHRRQRREGDRPRAALRRRVGAPAPPRQRGRADPRAAAPRRGGRPRPHPGDDLRRPRRRRACSPQYQEAGADRVVRWLPAAQRGPVERELERFEDAVRELRGE